MSTVLQIYEAIDRLAPFFLSMDFDNTGILVGDRQKKVERALLALDCTKEVLRQAKELGAQLIITHHPIIFHPIKRVNEDSLVYHLLRSDIAVISAHTNLDIAQGGVNDLLAKRIGLSDCRGLQPMDAQGTFFLGRVGSLPEGMEPQQFAQYRAFIEENRCYDTGITIRPGDRLLTLSTCAYHTANGRFLVVARQID